jgi:hypothetical protein
MKDDLGLAFAFTTSAQKLGPDESAREGPGNHAKRGIILPRSSFILAVTGDEVTG